MLMLWAMGNAPREPGLTLVVLAAGIGSRYGGLKQLEIVGPGGATLLDYGIFDALRAGFSRVVLVIRRELEPEFRLHMERIFRGRVAAAYAYQEMSALPPGFSVPAERKKPWGTGHAVLAAEPEVRGPFVVSNADDFYGAQAYTLLAEHLRAVARSREPVFAAAGYTLRDTLSAHGGVSRAVCEQDAHGFLRRVTEVKKVEAKDGAVTGVSDAGKSHRLSGDEIVSMNLWAATPAVFPMLHEQFEAFLRARGDDPGAEFLLSTAVNDQIEAGKARVKVIPTGGPWLGVTYKEDRPYVIERIAGLVAAGLYPADLAAPAGDAGP
jgi:choline kinase